MEVAAGDSGEDNVHMLMNSVKSGNLDKFLANQSYNESNRYLKGCEMVVIIFLNHLKAT